jgi:hypothetical protein
MEINSKIDRVKIYAAGATISRVAEFSVTETEVEIPGLPLALDDSTVQVRVESNSEHQPVATDVRIGLAVPPQTQTLPLPDEVEIKAAKTEVAKLEELLRLIDNEIQVLSQVEIPKDRKGTEKKRHLLHPRLCEWRSHIIKKNKFALDNWKSENLTKNYVKPKNISTICYRKKCGHLRRKKPDPMS